MACSVAIFSAARREVWLIGDCQCVVDGQHHTVEKAIDRVLSSMRANYLEALLKTGATIEELRRHDRGREFILPMLKQQSQYQNSHAKHPYAYGLLDGFPVNANSIKAISVKGERVSLATDGYPRMFGSLEETEQYLAKILREDPLCFRLYQATKGMMEGALSFDDRTYLTVKG
jgi:glycerophosphoryl diester phosphodiesterase